MEQPRIRTQATPHPTGAYPPDKFSTPIKIQIGREKTSPSQPPRYEEPRQYTNPGTPGGAPRAPDDDDPDDNNPDDQDDQEDEENLKEEEQEEQNPYVINPPLPVPEPLMLLLVACPVWSLELD